MHNKSCLNKCKQDDDRTNRLVVEINTLRTQLDQQDALLCDLLMENISPRLVGCIEVCLSTRSNAFKIGGLTMTIKPEDGMLSVNRIGSLEHIQHFDMRSWQGRVFVTTDLHGCYDLLHDALKEVAFNPVFDKLFVCGDLCDRGPDSRYVLDYLDEPWFHSICGNHDAMFIEAHESNWDDNNRSVVNLWINGGQWAWDLSEQQRDAICDVFKTLPLAIELQFEFGTVGLIHAEVPGRSWDSFKGITEAELTWNGLAVAQWARSKISNADPSVIGGIDLVISGHTPTKDGDPVILGNQLFIDSGCFFRDKINLIEINKELLEKYV